MLLYSLFGVRAGSDDRGADLSDRGPTRRSIGWAQAYPNPFNPEVVIPLDLVTDEERVDLALYDVLGRRVRQLWDGTAKGGESSFYCGMAATRAGKEVAAGVYIYKVEVDGRVEAKKTTKLP